LTGKIEFEDSVIQYLIDVYTYEAGCRKLKQLINDIIGKVNIDILENRTIMSFPIQIKPEDISNVYFKNVAPIRVTTIHKLPTVGLINCMYANDYGKGGILPTVGKLFPSKTFLEVKLTGLLDSMMTESFEVAKTLAWNLTSPERQNEFKTLHPDTGIHVHCGSGSVNKSGTSAGVAITILFYSIFNDKRIPNDLAITGEVNLQGRVCEIGALDYKIEGSVKAGVKKIIFPQSNITNFETFCQANPKIVEGINFYPVETIEELLPIVFI
jgi:ATP-dependent Lon protease